MSHPAYDVEHDSDGWWLVTRNGWRLNTDEFFTREEAETAVARYEAEDIENEREARDQDLAADKGDWEFHRNHDQ